MTTDYQQVIDRIYAEVHPMWRQAVPASYIPALAEADPSQFAIAIRTLSGDTYRKGAYDTAFSIQSISKVFTFAMVAPHLGDSIWNSVGREPSGTAFNSLVQLEYEHGRPRNPFINAGALVVTDRLIELYPRPKEAILDFVRAICGNPDIYYDNSIARSERATADRNLALAHLMKSFGNIHGDVDTLIDVYCSQCAISMTTVDLARSFQFLANRGVNPFDGKRILSASQAKRLGALMLTCGFYDESGDFAFRVGLPGKSGVGGGIAAYMPGNFSIGVWCPGLNSFGNSLLGIATLERFTTDIGNSIF
ncbi:MAG: glutaminase [Bacteroides sp.]|nr:glutaminase [Bacteroides sp.]MBD5347579.1 glutaminase [Bacteroides sp.]